MRISTNWLKKLSGVDAAPDDIAKKLTFAGLEVEGIRMVGHGLANVVVGEITDIKPHPQAHALSVLTVWDGICARSIVCGAPNAAKGKLIALALPGATLENGLRVNERTIAQVTSEGMACSESELALGTDTTGIFELDASHKESVGQEISALLDLKDAILDLSITPNRADCLGHIGIAREVALLFQAPFAPAEPSRALALSATSSAVSVAIEDTAGCPRYTAALFDNVNIGQSPFWLRYLLFTLGERSINNVVDITNLILLETGHPVHAFDWEKIAQRRIVVRRAVQGEKIRTLDGMERTLRTEDLVIADAKRPIAVAGVMGGEESAVSASTRSVLLECAVFEPRAVRRTARYLGLSTEASYRFERGVDPDDARQVIRGAATRLQELASATVPKSALDLYPTPRSPISIALRASRVSRVLGTDIDRTEAERILSGLGCRFETQERGWKVDVPSWRHDMSREIDLIEEYGRVSGYDRIPTELPPIPPRTGAGDTHRGRIQYLIRRGAATLGFHEAINYAFCSASSLERARIPAPPVALLNPLSEEQAVMRTSLLPGLLENLQHAERHHIENARYFEIGRIFFPKPTGELPLERTTCDLVISGDRQMWFSHDGPVDFYDGKGAVSALVHSVTSLPIRTERDAALSTEAPYLHPQQCARILVSDLEVGVMGALHPDVRDAFELVSPVIFASVDVEGLCLLCERASLSQAQPLPRFPVAIRDIALVVQDETTLADVTHTLSAVDPNRIENVVLFDVYRGSPVPKGHKSFALHVIYRDPDGTLSDADVNVLHAKLLKRAIEQLGAVPR